MVVDSSALIAILEAEEDAVFYSRALASADTAIISTASYVETGIVMLNRHGNTRRLDALVREAGLQLESVTPEQTRLALDAYARYGKGRKKGAGLNFGDCFSYALAKSMGLPLLYKGNDFAAIDITAPEEPGA